MTQEENNKDSFIVIISGINKENSFGPFDSKEIIGKILEKLGFKQTTRGNDIWWHKGTIDAYIRQLFGPDEIENY